MGAPKITGSAERLSPELLTVKKTARNGISAATDSLTRAPVQGPLFHGGPPGLKVGDRIKPSRETGADACVSASPDKVYVTTSWVMAMLYATPPRWDSVGWVYEVVPIGPVLGEDPEHPGGLVWVVDGDAEIVAVEQVPESVVAARLRLCEDVADLLVERESETSLLHEQLHGIDGELKRRRRLARMTIELLERGRRDMSEAMIADMIAVYSNVLRNLGLGRPRMPAQAQRRFNELVAAIDPSIPTMLSAIHGITHWRQTALMGQRLAAASEADATVVQLFAAIHDAHRMHDGHDPWHGERAADYADEYDGSIWPTLGTRRLDRLKRACAGHSRGDKTDDPTIGACWDADRLQLWRVGVRPDRDLLSTRAGAELLEWSCRIHVGVLAPGSPL